MSERLYFRQLLAGRDFARTNPVAAQMVNFCYLIGDRETRECVIVDPAWNVADLIDIASEDEMKVKGVLVTHYHPDHVGGNLFGHKVEGVASLKELADVPVHAHRDEARGIAIVSGLQPGDLTLHDGGDVVMVGEIPIELLHTPGHTPGSQCFLVDGRLVSGDTLFVQGCGRVDLPGGDAEEMYRTISQRLTRLPESTVLFPGHHYADVPTTTMGEQFATNYVFRPKNLEDWMSFMGR